MTLTPQWLDELRARTVLSTLIGRTVKVQKAGREFKACCPFHNEKTPSFTINDEKGFYHCFGCGAHGDAIRWMTDQRGLPFMDAVKELAQAASMEVPAADPRAAERAERANSLYDVMTAAAEWFTEQLQGIEGAPAREYLTKRGLSEATIKTFGMGFAPDSKSKLKAALKRFGDDRLVEAGLLISVEEKEPYDRFRGRIMIPIRDPRGRVIAFGGRILGEGEPKYLNSPDTPLFDKGRTLYNLDLAAAASRKTSRAIVVEGYMDVIALAQAGIGDAVAPLGTALTEHQIERLWRMVDVPLLCFDGDAAGQKAAIRAALRALPILIPGRSLQIAVMPAGDDPDDVVRSTGAAGFEAILAKATPLSEFLWHTQLDGAKLDTPEGRAAHGQNLRALAKTIKSDDVRVFYLADFNERLDGFFHKPRNFEARGSWGRPTRRVSPEALAIAEHGIDMHGFAPSVIGGLLAHTQLISAHAEVLAMVAVLMKRRDFKLLCEEMLDAALTHYPLEEQQLDTILREAGLAPELGRLKDKIRLAFSFNRRNADRESARQDLVLVLQTMATSPNLRAALESATKRLAGGDEGGFAEQVRLREALSEANQKLAALAHGSEDEI